MPPDGRAGAGGPHPVTTGTWNRASSAADTRYLDSSGNAIALSPGQIWIELVPNTVGVTVTP
jgi:hypothetical protein